MAIPSLGALSAQTINFELARSRSAELSIDTAENGGYGAINQNSPSRPNAANPAAYSEWYGYDHTAGGPGGNIISLGYNLNSANQACSNYLFGAVGLYGVDGDGTFIGAFTLYTPDFAQIATTGWYSDGTYNRRWVAGRTAAFTDTQVCIL
jgi:hypothetical protein